MRLSCEYINDVMLFLFTIMSCAMGFKLQEELVAPGSDVEAEAEVPLIRPRRSTRQHPDTLSQAEETQPAKKPRVGKKPMDAVELGMATRADADAFAAWMKDGSDPVRSVEGTLLAKQFFGTLQSPTNWVSSEVSYVPTLWFESSPSSSYGLPK